MLEVGINGYGTIGKRVADAVAQQPDMAVAGVAKRTPNYEAETAVDRGYDLYAADPDRVDAFEDASMPVSGAIDDLLDGCDVVIDATPAGIGERNRSRYRDHGVKAIYQGGEDADVAEASFNARANFAESTGVSGTRVVSCNTTGLSRLFAPLEELTGIERASVTLIRRGGDPNQTDRGPINDIVPDPAKIPSHHGPDVKTIIPDLDVTTMGIKVPATLMHVHAIDVTLSGETTREAILEKLSEEPRLFLVAGDLAVDGCGKLRDYALDSGRPRGDIWENCIWEESISVDGDRLCLFQAIHQEADVVPENVDAVRAVTGRADSVTSRERTDDALGLQN